MASTGSSSPDNEIFDNDVFDIESALLSISEGPRDKTTATTADDSMLVGGGIDSPPSGRPVSRFIVSTRDDFQPESIRPRRVASMSTSHSISLNSLDSGSSGSRRSSSSSQRVLPSSLTSDNNGRNDIEHALLCIPEDSTEQQHVDNNSISSAASNSNRSSGPNQNHSDLKQESRRERRPSLSSSQSRHNFKKKLAPNLNLRRNSKRPPSLRASLDNSDLSISEHSYGLDVSNHSDIGLSTSNHPVIIDDIDSIESGEHKQSKTQAEDDDDDDDDTNSVLSKASLTSSINTMRSSFRDKMQRSQTINNLRNRGKKKRQGRDSTNDQQVQRSTFDDPNYNFLAKDDKKSRVSLQAGSKWWRYVFIISFASLVACVLTLWAPYPIGARQPSSEVARHPWSDGCMGVESCICPRETICADDLLSMIFLTLARASAWFDYPLYMLLFLSKARNLNNFLQKTMLKCWVNFSDLHNVHATFGMIVGIESMSHAFFHLLRWARRQDDIRLLWTSQTGITGLICILLIPFIVLPMTLPLLKKKMTFELRKGLHYLSIVWGACLMYHAPQRIYWLIGLPLVTYAADQIFGVFYKTHLVENAYFERLGDSSCVITFENPPNFGKQNSAYVYIMLPWLSRYQFHVFSVYQCSKPNHSQLCISKSGGWTGDLIADITAPTHKPAFIVGPYLSSFCSPAMDYENLIAVASGIGVTPVISLMKKYLYTQRRLNLMWICRDPGLLEHFLNNVDFDVGDQGFTLVYYTGKRLLVITRDLPPNVLIYQGRPNLERTISGIISSIASGKEVLPDNVNDGLKNITKTPPEMRAKVLLEKALSIYSTDQLFQYAMDVSNSFDKDLELERLEDSVDFQGVLALMKQLLKDSCRSIKGKLTQTFEQYNSVAPHLLNRDEFGAFLGRMVEEAGADVESPAIAFNARRDSLFGSKGQSLGVLDSTFHSSDTNQTLGGNGKISARNWSLLYCGGSAPVLNDLKKYREQFGVGLAVEKFNW